MTEKTPVQEAIEALEMMHEYSTISAIDFDQKYGCSTEDFLASKAWKALTALRTLQSGKGEAVEHFQKCDGWGFREWYDRLQKAVKDHDAARVSGNDTKAEMCINIITSTAFHLARDFTTPPSPVSNSDKVDVEALVKRYGDEMCGCGNRNGCQVYAQAHGFADFLATLGLLRSGG